ncbi:MAG: 2-C-methyl-D-erythritol 2,4-cyclodiphosphate synthase, partial [Candidatus Omnitrophica bacterium]|nr:2-C-methyl-D-erythritol 2,4-cyclodiphosphate synthase [Candidatus Omnitrophota bacterium]
MTLSAGNKLPDIRSGIGYDVHPLVKGRALVLGGVEIPYALGLKGHSDADVLLHAIADAILGAAGKGDIGEHFPDTDAKYKGASSLVLLAEARKCVEAGGFKIVNIDCTLIAEEPKIRPHKPAMKENIARVLGIDPVRVNIKATT